MSSFFLGGGQYKFFKYILLEQTSYLNELLIFWSWFARKNIYKRKFVKYMCTLTFKKNKRFHDNYNVKVFFSNRINMI